MSQTFAALQRALPQHTLSRLIGKLAASERRWISGPFINQFARAYQVDLSEAVSKQTTDYASFNAFFTRALDPDARPLPDDPRQLACPADGKISQLGKLQADQLLQAKGHEYSIHSLGGELSSGFEDGDFCTIYLAPSDYHRVHLPFAGQLTATLAIPGALFSVNGQTEQAIDGLFCRNERLVCRFDTAFGPMLVVLVGAMIVASIETVWAGPQSPYRTTTRTDYAEDYHTGAEIGRFLLGSTVICCFPKNSVQLAPHLKLGDTVRMGQPLARLV